jgi:hypothetical protein
MEFATSSFEAQCLKRALAQDRQLKLAECSFQTKQQSVVGELGIIDILLIN